MRGQAGKPWSVPLNIDFTMVLFGLWEVAAAHLSGKFDCRIRPWLG